LVTQPADTPAAASDLISFPRRWMLLVAILSILSGQGSLV
jgi:hypothetical protein